MLRSLLTSLRKSTAFLTLVAVCLSFWVFPPPPVHAGWYQTVGWDYRMRLTIEASQVDDNLTDFPVYLDLSQIDDGHGFWRGVKSDGSDIRITQSDGETEVPVEVVDIDTSAYTGEIYFKADSLSSADDTQFWLYYGNSSATLPAVDATYGENNVWESTDHRAVWHLDEATSALVEDSTNSDVNEYTSNNASTDPGQLGDGFELTGTDSYITFQTNVGTHLRPTSAVTVEAWAKYDSIGNNVIIHHIDSTNKGWGLWNFNNNLHFQVGDNTANYFDNLTYPNASLSTGTWYHIVGTFDGDQGKLYLNGVEVDSYSKTTTISYVAVNSQAVIGKRGSEDYFDGVIDEIRVSAAYRSAGWISTSYNNQSAPESFLTFGDQEVSAGKTWYDVDWSHRTKITIDHTKVDEDLTDFPVYLDLLPLGSGHAFWSTVKSDGSDIRVTKIDGHREVPVDVVDIDTSGKTGEVHFLASTLSQSTDTEFWLYYGNAGATTYAEDDPYSREKVWSSYNQVYALDAAIATDIIDRTASDRDVTSETTQAPDYEQTGQVGKGVNFDGLEYLTIDAFNSSEYTTGLYMSAWIKLEGVSGNQQFMSIQSTGGLGASFHLLDNNIRAQMYISGTKSAYISNQVSADTWYHLVSWWDGTTWKVFKNGAEIYSASQSGTATMSAVGNNRISDQSWEFQGGIIDQVMISSDLNTMTNEWVSTMFNNQNSPSTFSTLGAHEALADIAWYSEGGTWTNRLAITIQSASVGADLNEFPVYLDLSTLPASFWTNVQGSSGEDVRITIADGLTEVPREIVNFTDNGTSGTGEVHFKISQLSAAYDNTVYIYYGNDSATEPAANDPYGSENVWETDALMVQHMTGANATSLTDSTQNNNDVTADEDTPLYNQTGKLGEAVNFDTTGDVLAVNDTLDLNTEFTVSFFMKPNATMNSSSSRTDIISRRNAYSFIYDWQDGQLSLLIGNDATHHSYTTTFSADTWYHIVGVRYSNNDTAVFINGQEVGSRTAQSATASSLYELHFASSDGGMTNYFKGFLDEILIYDKAFSPEEVATRYTNHNTSESFSTLGIEEEAPTANAGPGKRKAFMISHEKFYLPKESF